MGIFLATSLARTSPRGGQPTGTTALTTDFRIKDTASPRRNIWTSWPASESTSPCRKGNAAFVGSSEPQALFMRFSLVEFVVAAGTAAAAAKSGTAASFLRNDRRII